MAAFFLLMIAFFFGLVTIESGMKARERQSRDGHREPIIAAMLAASITIAAAFAAGRLSA